MRKRITSVRRDYVLSRVSDFITKMNISELPLDPFDLIKQNGWGLRTYKFYAKKFNCKLQDIIEAYGSLDGYTVYSDNIYSIAYNDLASPPGRIKFTLMHEIGHIYLRHLEEFEQTVLARGAGDLSDFEYGILEKEAGIFASEVLSPYPVLKTLNWSTYESLQKYCGLSKEAAKKRVKQLKEFHFPRSSAFYKTLITSNFYNFIFQRTCKKCYFGFIDRNANFCPICGNDFVWGKGTMKYDGFELDENGRALACPKCENDETTFEGDFCIICGSYYVNKCADVETFDRIFRSCETILPGNARYCYKCGNESTFLQNGILKPWDQTQSHSQVASTQEDDDVPF